MNSSRGFDPPRKLYEFYTVYQRPRHYTVRYSEYIHTVKTTVTWPVPAGKFRIDQNSIWNWCKKCRKAIQPLYKLRRTVLVLSPAAQNLWARSRISCWTGLRNDSSIWIRMWRNTIVYLLNCLDDVEALRPAVYRKRLNGSALFSSLCAARSNPHKCLSKFEEKVLCASFSMFGIFSRSHASGRMSPVFGEVSTGTSM